MVAPGQLLSIFGADVAPAEPFIPPGGVAASSATFGVYFNGIPAPILYSSAQQVNVQVPYEIAGQANVQMQVINKQIPLNLSETMSLGVAERQPSVSVANGSQSPYSGRAVAGGRVARNADGTLNDCTNPAIAGTTVTVFVNGLGPVTPALATGAIAQAPPLTLTPAVDMVDSNFSTVSSSTSSIPGTISGVAQVAVQVPPSAGSAAPFQVTPTVAGKTFRERLILIWTRSK